MARSGSNPPPRSSPRKRSRPTEDEVENKEGDGEVEEQPASKKTQFGLFPRLLSMFGAAANNPAEFEEAVRKSIPPEKAEQAAPSMSDRERSAFIANMIDERHAEIQEKEADEALRDPKRKLAWNPNIKPTDNDWIDFYDMIHEELQKKAVIDVLEAHFEDGQISMIQPMGTDGAALQIQNEHTALYNANIAKGGKYFGCGNNLTTKLTMLHFGLPVEPMTKNNILGCGKGKDEDDPPDEEEDELQRYERIYYAQKPLDFLDTYWERGHGYPILRQPGNKPENVRMRGGAGSPEEIGQPDFDSGTVHLRGGASNSRTSPRKKPNNSTGKSPAKNAATINVEKDAIGNLMPGELFPPTLGPRDNFNRERILKQRAAELKIQKYDPWLAEQRRQDRLQREAYYKDHHAVLPGQKPEPPLYGMVRELMLSVTDAQPTIYSQRLTPTDINAILDENQRARNKILERMDVCTLCDESFPKFQREDWRVHLEKHAEQMATAGKCPICATDQWTLMNMDQKKKHIVYHQDLAGYRHVMWDVDKCPVCDEQFTKLGHAEDVVYHLAEHQPGILRFCDRCGLEKFACSTSELYRHKTMCIEGPERTRKDPELLFCELCGKDRTNETEQELIDHRKKCSFTNRGYFCRKCGLDMSNLSLENRRRHVGRCKPPRGVKGKHCQRCGMDKSQLDQMGLLQHDRTCAFNEEKHPSAQELIEGLWLHQRLACKAGKLIDFTEMKAKIERQDELLRKSQAAAVEGVGFCPQVGCGVDLSNFAGYQIVEHMAEHLRNASTVPNTPALSSTGMELDDQFDQYSPDEGDDNDDQGDQAVNRSPTFFTRLTPSPAKTSSASPTKKTPKASTVKTTTPAKPKSTTKKAATGGKQKNKDSDSASDDEEESDGLEQPAEDDESESEPESESDFTPGSENSNDRKRKLYEKVGDDSAGNPVYETEEYLGDTDDGQPIKKKLYRRFRGADGQWVYQTDLSDESIPSDEISSEYTDGGSRIPKGTRGDLHRAAALKAQNKRKLKTKPKAPSAQTEDPDSISNPRQKQKPKPPTKPTPTKATKAPGKQPSSSSNEYHYDADIERRRRRKEAAAIAAALAAAGTAGAAKPTTKTPVKKPATKTPVKKPASKTPIKKPATKTPVKKPTAKPAIDDPFASDIEREQREAAGLPEEEDSPESEILSEPESEDDGEGKAGDGRGSVGGDSKKTASSVSKTDSGSDVSGFDAGYYESGSDIDDKDLNPDDVVKGTGKNVIGKKSKKDKDNPYRYTTLSDIPIEQRILWTEEDIELVTRRLEQGPLSPRWIKNKKVVPFYSDKDSPTRNPGKNITPESVPDVDVTSPIRKPTRRGTRTKTPTTSSTLGSSRVTKKTTPAPKKTTTAPKKTPGRKPSAAKPVKE
ncbi:hypothetical protein HYFRA_00010871 [Hymenoscyphus fraxineus]|uniref:Uncharacterized protein n=1 Tax=Hymenoscyphus fraxineus TaxID=746836 RepID=A0A9N9KXG7_9HELO|nr:hypothetical protein HYFRA_00010871 [Hymenoscyphus fraxineus]